MEVNIDAVALSTHFRELQQGNNLLRFYFNLASLKSNALPSYHLYHFFSFQIGFSGFSD